MDRSGPRFGLEIRKYRRRRGKVKKKKKVETPHLRVKVIKAIKAIQKKGLSASTRLFLSPMVWFVARGCDQTANGCWETYTPHQVKLSRKGAGLQAS